MTPSFSRWEKGEPAHRTPDLIRGEVLRAGDEGSVVPKDTPDPHPAREGRMLAHPCAQPSPIGRGKKQNGPGVSSGAALYSDRKDELTR